MRDSELFLSIQQLKEFYGDNWDLNFDTEVLRAEAIKNECINHFSKVLPDSTIKGYIEDYLKAHGKLPDCVGHYAG